jgi:leader peptidase (prepilin peptidase) / N-methyltransferase
MPLILYLETHAGAFILLAGLLGLIVGSFLNVVIHRTPIMLQRMWQRECAGLAEAATQESAGGEPYNLVWPGSRCPHCGHHIRAWENIPVISFLWLKGKCSACGAPISWRYPMVEISSAAVSAVVAWHFGYTFETGAVLLLSWALIALTFIDIDHQLLPDAITQPFLWLGLILNSFNLLPSKGLASAVIGAAAGYLSLWLVYHAFKLLTGKEGMGYGDFKLLALFGAWFGWQSLPLVILLASLVGAVVGLTFIVFAGRDRSLPIPFGPFLCAAGWIAALWGDEITSLYMQYARLTS